MVCCITALTSCSQPTPRSETSQAKETTETPKFSGPWAEEFRQAFESAPTDEIREYLRNEEITEVEKQAVTEAFRNCLTSQGLTFDDFNNDGSFGFGFASVTDPDKANLITNECQASTGVDQVISLYFHIRGNPGNKDLSEEIAACMIRSKTVPPEFTIDPSKSDLFAGLFLNDEVQAWTAYNTCTADPIGSFNE